VADRFAALGEVRAEAARRDQVTTQILQTTSAAVGDIGTGIVLLLLVPALARAEVGVGDVGVYATSVVVLAGLPRWAARYGATVRQADVSAERLAELLPAGSSPDGVTVPTPVALRTGPGPLPTVEPGDPATRGGDDRLERLEVRGLTVDHGTGAGVHDVDLVVERGTVTAVTGPVGAGKSPVLRALLGLVGSTGGQVLWNGEPLDDPGTLLVPPRVAYVAQTPRLFSEPLSDAVLLGVDPGGLVEAIELACLDDDVEHMPAGLATVVGARGVRLSGGQVQRTAAARAFVRRPELLVVDDLSSALDVQTEGRLWEQLLDPQRPARPAALLVVSHRPAVLERADRVVVLDAGRVVA
jgi:ATP-binding cassette subfamily B protein